ncbi:NUDIX hydrolase [Paenibacillus thermoaerophilus]|uniref:NUDIX hydrolase n=1 Tax=Paenibacillus thermoaerophilus TaxID=1215385 RepID=A0ABW2UZT1_9BACL|nr:NUDIX domain-containing protein [Paenibacillus thermoaerophilus]TMV19002.1 NUDIX domain-containing protein [Paenibacillus thermoaerophilus]
MKEISAGGVVYRNVPGGVEIQIIQDRFGRATLAKGKMEPGETIEQTALREILEETGIRGRIVEPLEVISYRYEHPTKGLVDKEVHYYLVEALDDRLTAQAEEISGVEWMTPEAAWRTQLASGYDNNDIVLRKALRRLGREDVVDGQSRN